jgi:hypothetical protein
VLFRSHEDAIAEIADELGIKGEEVEEIIKNHVEEFTKKEFSENFDDYNQVEPKEEPPAKGFKDYLSDLGSEREVTHAEKVFKVRIEWLDSSYNTQFTDVSIEAGTAKEAEQKAVADLRTKNGGKLNLIDTEVELSEANELTITKQGEMSTNAQYDISTEEAKDLLDRFPFGVLTNDFGFETNSFIVLGKDGSYRFYHSVTRDITRWDWKKDMADMIQSYDGDARDIKNFINGWVYEPADEFFEQTYERAGGLTFYEKVSGIELNECEVDEAFGRGPNGRRLATQFEHTLALLPCPGMFNVDQLGDNEYFGDSLKTGQSSIVCIAIDTGDKPRLTFASTYGGASDYRPGQNVLTYHDQTGKERPGTIITSFTGKEWSTPEGRDNIKRDMAKGGMDPRKKYSVRVFK